MAFEKVDREFVLSDSSVNVYGFKLLTAGYDMAEYAKNPIGYYMHDAKDGVLVKWEDIRLDGDKVVAKPVINMEHPRGQRTLQEVQDGFLNAASVGKIALLDSTVEDNPDNPEEPILVVTKWYNKECSLVDNPGNRAAIALCDEDGNELNLADKITTHKARTNTMKKVMIELTPAAVGLLGLADDADAAAVETALNALDKRAKDGDKAVKDLADERTAAETARVSELLDKGLADKKINAATKVKLAAQYAGKSKDLKDLLDAMTPMESVVAKIGAQAAKNVTDLHDKSWDELDRANKLQDLKDNAPDVFASKYLAKFGKEYKG